jgi:hypothetical protein
MAKKDGRAEEKRMLEVMIDCYCRGVHKNRARCADCEALLIYAQKRSENCPHRADKTFCSACKTHCYQPEMREKIRAVMRYSGPRMLLFHPLVSIKHMISTLRAR